MDGQYQTGRDAVARWRLRSVFILFGVMGERARPNITNSLYLNPTPPGISVGDI